MALGRRICVMAIVTKVSMASVMADAHFAIDIESCAKEIRCKRLTLSDSKALFNRNTLYWDGCGLLFPIFAIVKSSSSSSGSPDSLLMWSE